MELGDLDHPSFFSAAGTFVAYGVILVAMFVLLFVVPYGLFTVLG